MGLCIAVDEAFIETHLLAQWPALQFHSSWEHMADSVKLDSIVTACAVPIFCPVDPLLEPVRWRHVTLWM
jgi:hypothetical protein